ncbi:MAG: TonB-dependent receptor [Saprospiraceae bacterium]
MKKINLLLFIFLLSFSTFFAQNVNTGLKSSVVNENKDAIGYATITLFQTSDSAMTKAGYSSEDGTFILTHLLPGTYYLNVSFVGYDTYISPTFQVTEGNILELENIKMLPFAMELGEVVVAASKPLIEVKPDKTVFNVEGSVNSIGNNGLELLRKAPGVVVDNNDHLMLIGKSGVKVYIDGRQSILTGDDLSNYLKSLQSSQIEAIEVITQPSSRYEADGNAGIINIRLIKDKSLGTNANLSLGYNQATHGRFDGNISLNNRTQFVNVFGNYNYANGQSSQFNFFERTTPDLFTDQQNTGGNSWENHSLRAGVDFTASTNATIGVLVDGFMNSDVWTSKIHTAISPSRSQAATEFLEATNRVESNQDNVNINGNYKYDNKKGTVLNLDGDFGKYRSVGDSYQPNFYYDPSNGALINSRIFSSHAPTDIEIKTLKLDYEKGLFGGTVGTGFKLALVNTDNNYEFYDIIDDDAILNIDRTNRFNYAENVNAAYVNFSRQWKKIGFQFGVRMEQTDSKGYLTSRKPQNDEIVKQDYVDLFPSGGLTYQINQKNSLRLTYSRRIDRPNYRDLNPFEWKLDELTFKKGNPFLKPQFSNSLSLGHTFNYTLNTTLSYTHTKDLMSEITDTASMRAAYITTENIADQDVYSLSISYPFALEKWWNVFANTSVSNTHNKADFGNGKIVDITATTFNVYMQHSFTLPGAFTFEVSGWYNSPGIWGGNFATKSMWSIDAGLSKKFWKERATVKLGVADIFDSQNWSGVNDFGALALSAHGGWESRQAKLNFNYLIGSNQIKGNRKRSTGLEDESKRIQSGK